MTRTEMNNLYNQFKEENKISEVTNLARTMRAEYAEEDNWKYTFFFDRNILTKIEAYNGRELIEAYANQR